MDVLKSQVTDPGVYDKQEKPTADSMAHRPHEEHDLHAVLAAGEGTPRGQGDPSFCCICHFMPLMLRYLLHRTPRLLHSCAWVSCA